MQVRIDYDIDLFWLHSIVCKRIGVWVALHKPINISQFRVPLRPVPRLHQNILPARADQQRICRKRNAVPLIGRHFLFPQRLRHHAKHGPAVQPKNPAINVPNLNFPKVHSLPQTTTPLFASNSLTAVNGSFLRSATSFAIAASRASPPAPPNTRSTRRDSSNPNSRRFQCSTCFRSRSPLASKCFRNFPIVSANTSIPLFSLDTVRTTGGCQPSRGITSDSIASNCCSNRSAPSRSALFKTKISPISITPAFIF